MLLVACQESLYVAERMIILKTKTENTFTLYNPRV